MSTTTTTPAALITARLDRLPATRHIWVMVLLMALGGCFETYDIFFTAYVAPGLFKAGIFTPTTVSFFGLTGLASFIAALFLGLFIGTIAVSYIADRFGRRTIFVFALLWYCVATAILAFQNTAGALNLWRFIAGIGIGVELVTIDAYLSEIVPKSIRGKAFAFQQGVGFASVPIVAFLAWMLVPTAPLGFDGWRWVVLIGSAGAIVIWFLRLGPPESPRWLAQQGRLQEAEHVMAALEAKVQAEYGRPLPPVGAPEAEDPRPGRYSEIFSPEYRGRTIMLMVFNFAQTIGFYGFANWVPTLLIAKGIHVTQTLEYTFIIALAYPAWPLISMLFADKMERKWQICAGALGIAVFGILFSTQEAAAALIVIGLFQTASNTWLSFSFHNYQSELYPTRVRARAVGFVYSWSRISVVFTSYIIAFVLQNFGVTGVFTFIALAMGVVIVSIAAFGPRTNQLALEAISR
jgi:MFS transporter, putative metabolite:H+ symporter